MWNERRPQRRQSVCDLFYSVPFQSIAVIEERRGGGTNMTLSKGSILPRQLIFIAITIIAADGVDAYPVPLVIVARRNYY